MRRKYLSCILLSLTILLACNGRPDNIIQEENKRSDEIINARLLKLKNAEIKTGFLIGFDSINFRYTFQIQNFLKRNNQILLDRVHLHDIEKLDSNYILSIYTGSSPQLYFEISCSEEQLKQLLPEALNNSFENRIFSINRIIGLRLDEVKKVRLSVTKISGNNNEEPDIDLFFEASSNFMIKGDLIYIENNL